MTSDGTNSFAWDAESRLLQITYTGSGNNTQFSYDAFGNRVKIVENGSSPPYTGNATKQFVVCGGRKCEERDGSGAVVTQFFKRGYRNGGNSLYYGKPHLGSITEVTNSSGAIVAQVAFGPYGEPTLLQGSALPDFGYAGYYYHGRSQLNLTRTRAYSASLGRFISRDPIAEAGGVNLYAYVGGNPISLREPQGTGYEGVMSGAAGSVGGFLGELGAAGLIVGGVIGIPVGIADIASGRPGAAINEGIGTLTSPGGWLEGMGGNTGHSSSSQGILPTSCEMRGKNKAKPVQGAAGAHSTWVTTPSGEIRRTETWVPNSQNPTGFDSEKSTDFVGAEHAGVPTPHTEITATGETRPATPEETPANVAKPKPGP